VALAALWCPVSALVGAAVCMYVCMYSRMVVKESAMIAEEGVAAQMSCKTTSMQWLVDIMQRFVYLYARISGMWCSGF
jgi:hypothetical protein